MSAPLVPDLPERQTARRRDRRGRGIRGPLIPASLPGARTRRELLEDVLREEIVRLSRRIEHLSRDVEFAIEDVPPSDPPPWEQRGITCGRYFPADRAAGLRHRIVLYRRPIQSRYTSRVELEEIVHHVLAEQVAQVFGHDPDTL